MNTLKVDAVTNDSEAWETRKTKKIRKKSMNKMVQELQPEIVLSCSNTINKFTKDNKSPKPQFEEQKEKLASLEEPQPVLKSINPQKTKDYKVKSFEKRNIIKDLFIEAEDNANINILINNPQSTIRKTSRKIYIKNEEHTSKKSGASTPVPNSELSLNNTKHENDSDNAKKNICVAIVTDRGLPITRAQTQHTLQLLETKLIKDILAGMYPGPAFICKPLEANGMLKLRCANEMTVEWLQKTILEYIPGVGEPRLAVKLEYLKMFVQGAILFPKTNVTASAAQSILTMQNSWARVRTWSIYKEERRGNDLYVVFKIPYRLTTIIESKGSLVYFILDKVHIDFLKD